MTYRANGWAMAELYSPSSTASVAGKPDRFPYGARLEDGAREKHVWECAMDAIYGEPADLLWLCWR